MLCSLIGFWFLHGFLNLLFHVQLVLFDLSRLWSWHCSLISAFSIYTCYLFTIPKGCKTMFRILFLKCFRVKSLITQTIIIKRCTIYDRCTLINGLAEGNDLISRVALQKRDYYIVLHVKHFQIMWLLSWLYWRGDIHTQK